LLPFAEIGKEDSMRSIGKFFRRDASGNAEPAYPAKYRCVRVNPGAVPCGLARNIAGRRFLPDEIPALPLPGCDAGACECSYELLDDRRDGKREASNATG